MRVVVCNWLISYVLTVHRTEVYTVSTQIAQTISHIPAWALSISQSAVTGVTALEAQPAYLGPAAALIRRWVFLRPMALVWDPPSMPTKL